MSVIYRVVIAVAAGVMVLVIFLLGAVAAPAQDLGFIAEAAFSRFDSNDDGVVSKQEVTSVRDQLFARIDTDRNGVVTLAEIEAAKAKAEGNRLRRLARIAALRAEMQTPSERFAALDQNHDGKVSRQEFVSASPWFDRISKGGRGITKTDFAAFLDAAN